MRRTLIAHVCKVALLSVPLAFLAPTPSGAQAGRFCPQFVMTYCVKAHGHRRTMATNPCFARQRGIRILHVGACDRA